MLTYVRYFVLLHDVLGCCIADEISAILKKCRKYRDGSIPFVFDEEMEKREKEQAALRKIEHSKRKLFEGKSKHQLKIHRKKIPTIYLQR